VLLLRWLAVVLTSMPSNLACKGRSSIKNAARNCVWYGKVVQEVNRGEAELCSTWRGGEYALCLQAGLGGPAHLRGLLAHAGGLCCDSTMATTSSRNQTNRHWPFVSLSKWHVVVGLGVLGRSA
jgi:hypothetical protein